MSRPPTARCEPLAGMVVPGPNGLSVEPAAYSGEEQPERQHTVISKGRSKAGERAIGRGAEHSLLHFEQGLVHSHVIPVMQAVVLPPLAHQL